MADPPAIPANTVVAGKLRVVRLLGMGGMGAVYEVEHEFTKHRRALKLLHAEMLQHPVVVARFVREASAAGHIGNPHIVETFDAGTLPGGEPYLVMEMLQGETLADRLQKAHRLPLPELVDVIRQACDGVQAAHEVGIVHRDLKPENLFLIEKDGKPFVKILDFGVSKFDAELTGADVATKEGSMVGTPYYMSPEQVDGDKDLDARTDVYALGVILYQCACGIRPFQADALPKLAVLIHEGKPVPLSRQRPDLPASFVDVVERAMARDRDRRFPTAKELGAALEPFGAVALDATMLETSAVRGPSRAPSAVAIARSEPPPATTAPRADAPQDKPPVLAPLTGAGSALSIHNRASDVERRTPGKTRTVVIVGMAVVGALVAAGVIGAMGGVAGYKAGAGKGPSPAVFVPVVPSPVTAETPAAATAPSTVALTPLPSGTVTPGASAPVAPSASHPGPVSVAPTGSSRTPPSRVEQKGLANDNPFK